MKNSFLKKYFKLLEDVDYGSRTSGMKNNQGDSSFRSAVKAAKIYLRMKDPPAISEKLEEIKSKEKGEDEMKKKKPRIADVYFDKPFTKLSKKDRQKLEKIAEEVCKLEKKKGSKKLQSGKKGG